MASPTQWVWVWVNSGSWWWTGRPGVLLFMGLQRVGHDWVIELNFIAITPPIRHVAWVCKRQCVLWEASIEARRICIWRGCITKSLSPVKENVTSSSMAWEGEFWSGGQLAIPSSSRWPAAPVFLCEKGLITASPGSSVGCSAQVVRSLKFPTSSSAGKKVSVSMRSPAAQPFSTWLSNTLSGQASLLNSAQIPEA